MASSAWAHGRSARRARPAVARGPVACAALALACGLAACSAPSLQAPAAAPVLPPFPEAATVQQAKPGWAVQRHAVASGHPLASAAGLAALEDGGSALDAAVAVQMVLTLVEPQSSGIGGGAFLMHWDGQSVQAWDGRETAPAAVDERLFIGADGKPMPFAQALVGGRAVGVPGAVRMLEAAHRQHGRLPWARLVAPAIQLAEQGFPMSQRLFMQLQGNQALRADPQAFAHFYQADGQPHPVGHVLRNPALAAVLRRIATEGSAGLLAGPVAEDMVRRVQGHAGNPGRLALADLAGYQPQQALQDAQDLHHRQVAG